MEQNEQFSKVLLDLDFQSEILKFFNKKIVDKNFIVYDGSNIRTTSKMYLPASFTFDNSSGLEKIFSSFILDGYYRSELLAPGSGQLCIKFLFSLIEKYKKNSLLGLGDENFHGDVDFFVSDVKKIFQQSSRISTLKDLKKILLRGPGEKNLVETCLKCLELSGMTGTIHILDQVTDKTILERNGGYTFKLPQKSYHGSWQRRNTQCLVIDGIIESISEIHGLLETLSSSDIPVAIIARSFSPDVVNTILVNNARETLDVALVSVGYEIENTNILVDISKVVGTDLISPLKGDLVSTTKLEELKNTDLLTLHENNLVIVNNSTSPSVKSHLDRIRRKISTSEDLGVRKILEKRIKSLQPCCVSVKLSRDIGQNSREKLDYMFRITKCIIENGVCDPCDSLIADSKYFPNLTEEISRVFSPIQVESSILNALSLFKIFKNIDHTILLDREI